MSRRDVAFLQEDVADQADINSRKATAIRKLVDAGFDPATVVEAIDTNDLALLEHTGRLSVQLQDQGV